MSDAPMVSVVVPVFNEEENIRPLAEEVLDTCRELESLELVYADDGSSDATWRTITSVAGEHAEVRGIRSRQNRGQSAAMLMGMRAARGGVIVMIDGDLQNDPADIPRMVRELETVDVVCGYRANRKDTWSRRVASRIANKVRRWVTRDTVRDTGCSLKAFHRKCVDDLPPLMGMHRFMPAYFQLNGRALRDVAVNHRARQFGTSKYTNLMRLPRTVFDLVGFVWYRRRYRAHLGAEDVETT